MGSNRNGWTPEQQEQLLTMAAQGFSASEIGDAVGRSRNAVLGRCFREGISLQDINQWAKDKTVVTKRNRVKQNLMKVVTRPKFTWQDRIAPVSTKPLRISFIDLEPSECRYILGKTAGAATVYCGLPVVEPHSYCVEHCRTCFDLSRMRGSGFHFNLTIR